MTTKNETVSVGPNSERIVVDEIFENGSARVLRAKRIRSSAKDDLSIETWGEEEADILKAWRVAAFVGLPSGRQLLEGDVFLVKDGSKLHAKYIPIPRDAARDEHLIVPWDKSRQMARQEIQKQTNLLAAAHLAVGDTRAFETLEKRIDKKFSQESI